MTGPETASGRSTSPDPATVPPPPADEQSQRISPAAAEVQQELQELQQQAPSTSQLPLRMPFQPLFTLVVDDSTRATYHPHVHYIFSDDDPDVLTEALAAQQQRHPHHQRSRASPASGSTGSGSAAASGHSPGGQNFPERAIVLDLVPKPPSTSGDGAAGPGAGDNSAGYEVAWASSLSSDWAVVSAKLSPMEGDEEGAATGGSTGAEEDGSAAGSQQLMLRIEGVGTEGGTGLAGPSAATTRAGKSRSASLEAAGEMNLSGSGARHAGGNIPSPGQQEDYSALLDEFEKRMSVLRRVVDAGRERQLQATADLAAADLGAAAAGLEPEPEQQYQEEPPAENVADAKNAGGE